MSRDGSGNYTLPLPPVVDGTIISPAWANTTLDDMAIEITDSLDRKGRGGMNVAFGNLDGTVEAPGIGFANEASSGFRFVGLTNMHATIAGKDVARWIYYIVPPAAGDQRPFQIWDGSDWFEPLDPDDPLGDRTFATVGSKDAVTVGTGLSVSGGLTIDEGGITAVGDSIIDGDLIGGGPSAFSGSYVGAYILSNGVLRREVTGTIDTVARTAIGKYVITLVGTWPSAGNPVAMATPAGGSATKMYATVERTSPNSVTVYIKNLTTNAATDNDFTFFGII